MQKGSDVAANIIKRADQEKSNRANFDNQFEVISKYVLPRAKGFNSKRTPGERLDTYIHDSTAALALPSFAAAIESLVIPRTQKYHGFKPSNPALLENIEVMTYLERLKDLVFRLRYSPKANFASQASEVFLSLGAFGTGALLIEDGMAGSIRYRSIPLSQLWLTEDAWGTINGFFWRYELTPDQAIEKFGDEVPEAIQKAQDKSRKFEFIFHVCPNDNVEFGNVGRKGMKYAAYDVCVEGKVLLRQGGYRAFPLAVSRYTVAPGEVYGRSPAWDALADIQAVNEMEKTGLRYAQLSADPVWITADVDSLSPFSARPGALNAGYLNERGDAMVKSLSPQGDPRFSADKQKQKRESINRAFLITLFQILVDTPQMTATEAMYRAQEKGALLAPAMGRQQSEFLGSIVTREIDILNASGIIEDTLGPIPDALLMHGGSIEIEYDSPLTRAQRTEEGLGVLRTLEAIGTIAQYDQSVLGEINYHRGLKIIADANGAPLSLFNTPEEKQAMEQQKQQQADLALALQAAPVIANTAKSAAQAQNAATQSPF